MFFGWVMFMFTSCKTKSKYSYAIKDFRTVLQPFLTSVVSTGVVMYYDSAFRHIATDQELICLSTSEHPVLRASALREIFYRNLPNRNELLLSHLDDTAIVATDAGEFGTRLEMVSDDILEQATWTKKEDRDLVVDRVITQHNYLRSAYTALLKLEPQNLYYSYIRTMASRPFESNRFGSYAPESVDCALYSLAQFQKPEDKKLLKGILLQISLRNSLYRMKLLKDFPDTSYIDVLDNYYPRNFYYDLCNGTSDAQALEFIEVVGTYKSLRSAKILDSILNFKRSFCYPAQSEYFKKSLAYAIWDNDCPAYAALRKQVRLAILQYEKTKLEALPIEELEPLPGDNEDCLWRW